MADAPSEKKAKTDLPDEESYLLRATFKGDEKFVRGMLPALSLVSHLIVCAEIEIGARHTLGQLEEALLGSIGYKSDTLNAFYLDGKPLSKASGVLFYSGTARCFRIGSPSSGR